MGSKIFIYGVIVSGIITVICNHYGQRPVDTVILVVLQYILTFCFELRYKQSVSDDILGDVANRLRQDPSLKEDIRHFADEALKARAHKSNLVNEHLNHIIQSARISTQELANGNLKVDLGPGGRYFPDLVDLCRHKYQGVSIVDLEEYWHGPVGRASLKQCGKAVQNKKTVERIFIERRANLSTLASFVREHKAVGIQCFVVVSENVDSSLRKDFAIIDDNEAAVQIHVDKEGTCTEAHYCVNRENSAGCTQLHALFDIWQRLMNNATPADEFLRDYPPTRTPVSMPASLAEMPNSSDRVIS